MDINDINGDGKYNVNDFLEMDNKEILDQNGGKKFDIILGNPPWSKSIHYEFTQKWLDIADKVISIMPNSIIKRESKHFKKFKDVYNDKLYEVEEVDSKLFEGTNMQNCCIFCFGPNKENLHIKYLNGKTENIKGILEKDYSGFSDYEKEFIKYIYNENSNIIDGAGFSVNGKTESPKNFLDIYVNKILSKLPDNKAYLVCNATDGTPHGGWSHKYFSSKVGQIFDNKEDLKKFLYERNGKLTHYMWFNNKKCAENAKAAMQRPLLRFPLVKKQDNQRLVKSQYHYIPNIDWSNIKSDYDILKTCKCPNNKIEEYIEYVTNIINKFDEERK